MQKHFRSRCPHFSHGIQSDRKQRQTAQSKKGAHAVCRSSIVVESSKNSGRDTIVLVEGKGQHWFPVIWKPTVITWAASFRRLQRGAE
jgi:hypothetical protein